MAMQLVDRRTGRWKRKTDTNTSSTTSTRTLSDPVVHFLTLALNMSRYFQAVASPSKYGLGGNLEANRHQKPLTHKRNRQRKRRASQVN